jgi:hypothetical protein
MPWPTATDYVEAIQYPRTCFKDNDLQDGTPALDRLGMPFVSSGQFAYVFKLKHATGKASAIRCFRGLIGGREQRYQAIDKHLDSVSVSSLASFEYDSNGILVGPNRFPILVMEWIDGPTLDVYIEAALQNRSMLQHLSDEWIRIVKGLRTAQIAHGDLQHGNIIVQNGALRLVDLDGMFVPSMSHLNSIELGHRHYQHPRRDELFFNCDLDNFSALVIYISLISIAERPELWKIFHDENLIFTRPDFLSPHNSRVFQEIKKMGGEPKRLVEILEKACQAAPSAAPVLPDLVSPVSKLPSWMRESVGVAILTKTREVIPGSPLSGAISKPGASTGVSSIPVPPSTLGAGANRNISLSSSHPSATGSLPLRLQKTDWRAVRIETLSTAFGFGMMGILLVWAWFPLLNGIYRDIGLRSNSESLTLWTYVVGCVGFGFARAYLKARKPGSQPISYSSSSVPARPATPVSSPPFTYSPAPTRNPIPTRYSTRKRRRATRYTGSIPAQAGSVVGSRARLIYHRPSCEWAEKMSIRNKITFASPADAQSAGFRACGVCLP